MKAWILLVVLAVGMVLGGCKDKTTEGQLQDVKVEWVEEFTDDSWRTFEVNAYGHQFWLQIPEKKVESLMLHWDNTTTPIRPSVVIYDNLEIIRRETLRSCQKDIKDLKQRVKKIEDISGW